MGPSRVSSRMGGGAGQRVGRANDAAVVAGAAAHRTPSPGRCSGRVVPVSSAVETRDDSAGHSLRPSADAAARRLYGDRDRHARAQHRCDDGHVQRDPCRAAPALAVQGAIAPGQGLGERSAERQAALRGGACELRRLAKPDADVRAARRVHHARRQPRGLGRRAVPRERRCRDAELLRDAWRDAGARAAVDGRGRCPSQQSHPDPQPRRVADALRIRPKRDRSNRPVRRRTLSDRCGHAPGVYVP